MTPEQRAILLEDPANGPEFSVRVMNTAASHGVKTLGELKDKLDSGVIAKHWKGIGSKSLNEMKEFFHWLERPTKSLFEDPDYVKHLMEDRLTTVTALLHDVQNRLLQAALKGRVSKDMRRDMAFKLRDAAQYVEQLPLYQGEE